MAPKKLSTSSSASAGAGMITRSITKSRAVTHQPTTTRSKFKAQASTTIQAPITQSSRSGKATRIHKSSPTKSTSSKKAKGNQASRRKAAALDTISSSSPVASSPDVEAGPSTQPKITASHHAASEPVHPKVAAFQAARGLSFDQLYVESDDVASSSDIALDSDTMPQMTSGATTKATGATAASKRPKRTSVKRSLDSDDSQDATGVDSSSPAPIAKRLKLTLKKLTTPASNKKPIAPVSNDKPLTTPASNKKPITPISNDKPTARVSRKKRAAENNNDAPPAKRIGIEVDDLAPEVENAPTDSAPIGITVDEPVSGKKRAGKKRAAENNHDAPPTKRLFITVDDPAPEVEDAPTDSAPDATVPDTAAADVTASGNSKSTSKGAAVITKNGKVKKTPEYAVEHAFEGTASGHGTSMESPEFGTLDKPWFCANLNCTTGMTWVPRDHKDSKSGKGPMGRKVISQFFGRNKGPTKLIPNDVWHFYCRKDYQRGRYAAEHGTVHDLARYVMQNLRDQLIRLKLWRPDALFQVQLDKGATDRLNAYFAALRQHNNDEAAALASLPGPKDPKKEKPEEVFPPSLSETFNRRFKTAGKAATANYDDIEAIIAWSEAEIAAGRSKVFVPCEFLINPPQPGETENDISNNFAQWEVIHHDLKRAEAEAAAAAAASEDSASGTPTSDDSSSDDAASQEIKSSPVPSVKKVSKGKGKATFIKPDPDATESNSDADEPVTPTPAPRQSYNIQADPNDPMSLMRILNNVAADMGYHARSDSS